MNGRSRYWWLRSPYNNNDNNAGVVNGSGIMNNNNVNNDNNYGARPASPYSPMSFPSGDDLCKRGSPDAYIRQRNPVPFRKIIEFTEEHMPSVHLTRTRYHPDRKL